MAENPRDGNFVHTISGVDPADDLTPYTPRVDPVTRRLHVQTSRMIDLTSFTDITTDPQSFTSSFVDLGSEISTNGFKTLSIWFRIDINDTLNARFRLLAKTVSAGAVEYTFPIKTVTSSLITVEEEFFEFNVDADQDIVISADLDFTIPVVQVQISAGTVGAGAGQILSSGFTLG